jgi:hypothetical protein
LLIWRILYRVPRVRIPPSPPVLLGFSRSESLFYEPAPVPISGRVGRRWARFEAGCVPAPSSEDISFHRKIVGRYPTPVVLRQHLQGAMAHLPLNPVERFVLLKRQDGEAVTALPDWSVWNFRSRENATPHYVGCPADIRRTATSFGGTRTCCGAGLFPVA